jgi:hypothetical protein
MNPTKNNLVVISAWYKDELGKTKMLSFDTYGEYEYRDYLGYQYFGVGSFITNSNVPPLWRNHTYPINANNAIEHGERSRRTIEFSNITGLKPKSFKTEPQYVLDDYKALRTTNFFDHVSIWSDNFGHIYYLLEPYSISNTWRGIFHSVGFEAIEIHRPIAPYQGGDQFSSSRSFLVCRYKNPNQPHQNNQIQKIQMSLINYFEFLSNDPDTYIDTIREMEAIDE